MKKDLAQLPCTVLKGVGSQIAKCLAKLEINSVQDLLFHLPLHYQDRTHITPIADLRAGRYAVVEGVIQDTEVKQGRRLSLICRIVDGSGIVSLRFFHFNQNIQKSLSKGSRIRCFAEVRRGVSGLEMIHAEYRIITHQEPVLVEETMTPIYPTTAGLNQYRLRDLTNQALKFLAQEQGLDELLPEEIRKQFNLPNLCEAINLVHRPPPEAQTVLLEQGLHPAQQRLAFEELLVHHLSLRHLHVQLQTDQAYSMNNVNELRNKFLTSLPFSLTKAQQKVTQEIIQDMLQARPMLRLLQGDVGCGKTLVAALAMLLVVENKYQVALMAPTELLAEQHFQNFRNWLAPLGIPVVWLAGKLKGKVREKILAEIASGDSAIIIGTHALFQEDVVFANLALIVVDEQHRFGVHQRLALREKGQQQNIYPHQLIMSATPIPRTLAMLFYADLDCSIIDELPPGRTPVQTIALANSRRDEVIQRVRQACHEKKQAYWVCTLIEESELLQAQAAQATQVQLEQSLPELRIGLIHGKLKSIEKEALMAEFKAGAIDLLVATTVIEVGVDVPNASLMVIENAERLGLAQLHQLRGRVGRGTQTSYCVLMYQPPLSMLAKERLAVMRETHDGFVIARRDMDMRGIGEVLGTRQAGLVKFRIADLQRDKSLFDQIQQAANLILQKHQTCIEPLLQRWLGDSSRYVNV